jgi:hypothetical protein
MLHDVPVDAAVEYLAVFTREWSVDSVLELTADMAAILQWSPDHARSFAVRLAWALQATRQLGEHDVARLQLFCFHAAPSSGPHVHTAPHPTSTPAPAPATITFTALPTTIPSSAAHEAVSALTHLTRTEHTCR